MVRPLHDNGTPAGPSFSGIFSPRPLGRNVLSSKGCADAFSYIFQTSIFFWASYLMNIGNLDRQINATESSREKHAEAWAGRTQNQLVTSHQPVLDFTLAQRHEFDLGPYRLSYGCQT